MRLRWFQGIRKKAERSRNPQLWHYFFSLMADDMCHFVKATFSYGPRTVLMPVGKRSVLLGAVLTLIVSLKGREPCWKERNGPNANKWLTPGKPALDPAPIINVRADHFPQSAVREGKTLCTFIQNKNNTVTQASFDLQRTKSWAFPISLDSGQKPPHPWLSELLSEDVTQRVGDNCVRGFCFSTMKRQM